MRGRTRCLVLRPGALGDAILTLPAFGLIAREFSNLTPVLAASPPGCRVGDLSGLFKFTRAYESPELTALFVDAVERNSAFDDVGALIAFGAAGAGDLAERARRAGVPLAASVDTWPASGEGHVAEQLLYRTADALGIDLQADPLEPRGATRLAVADFSTPESPAALPHLDITPDVAVWARRPGLRIAVAPGAGSPEKCWPSRNFARTCALLARELEVHVMLVLGPAEMERPEVRAAFADVDCTISECWSVGDLAAALAACHLYLGNDSGLSHLAAWAGAEGLVVFGPTDPDLWAPLGHIEPLLQPGLTPEKLADSAAAILGRA